MAMCGPRPPRSGPSLLFAHSARPLQIYRVERPKKSNPRSRRGRRAAICAPGTESVPPVCPTNSRPLGQLSWGWPGVAPALSALPDHSASSRSFPLKSNAVQLGTWSSGNAGSGRASGLRPRPMLSPLHVPLHVLAFDDPGVAAQSPSRVEPAGEQDNGVTPTMVRRLRGKNRAPLRSSGERCGGRRRS